MRKPCGHLPQICMFVHLFVLNKTWIEDMKSYDKIKLLGQKFQH